MNASEKELTRSAMDTQSTDEPGGRNDNITPREHPMTALEGRDIVEPDSVCQRLDGLESRTRSPTNVYAIKVASAALVFGPFLWTED